VTLDQLDAFVAVIREGTITAAAQSLHKSQPAISKLVSNLEAELGVALLDRSRHRATATDEGLAFFERAATLLRDAHSLRELGTNLGGTPERRVRITIDAVTPLPPVLEVLARTRRQYPTVRIEVDVGQWTGASASLLDGNADLAIASGPVPDSPRLVARPFPAVTIVPVVRADHPLAVTDSPPEDVLRQHPQVVLSDQTGAESTRSLNVLRDGLAWRVTDLHAKKQIIIAGLGWGGLPEHLVAPELAAGTLRRLHIASFETHVMPLHVLRRKTRARRVITATLWRELSDIARHAGDPSVGLSRGRRAADR
jgi:DNA-binding transcriptional LysR family regulator